MKTYIRLLSYLYPYKGRIFITCILSLFILALQGISVWVGAGFIEKLLTGEEFYPIAANSGKLATVMDGLVLKILQRSTPFKSLISGVFVLGGAAFLTALFRSLKIYLFVKAIESILADIRTKMFSCITRLDLSFSKKYKPGEITSLIVKDVDQLRTAFFDVADRIFMQPLRLIMAFFLMLSLSTSLALLIFFFLIVSSMLIHLVGDRIETLVKKAMEKVAHLQGHLTEYLSTVILARSLGREEHEKDSFLQSCLSLAKTNVEYSLVRSVAPQLVNILFVLSGGVILLIGGHNVLVSKTIPGTVLIKMALLLPVATYPIKSLASLYLSLRVSMASAQRIFPLLDTPITFQDLPNASEPKPFKNCIKLENVTYIIDNRKILNDISMTIPRGSKIVIYGPSGAGKTSVLSVIAGFILPNEGAILIDEYNLRNLKGASWRRQLGIITQEPVLLNDTVRENLLYACPNATEEKLICALNEVHLWGENRVFSKGLDTVIGNRGEMLSGGERQRLTIARALLNDPEILLMDEPTSMLDDENKKKIIDAICSVAKGRTLIIATHDSVLRELSDIKFELKAGKLIK